MNLRKLALCLLALPFVWACSSDNDSEEIAPEPTPAPKFFPLNITVEENPLVDPSEYYEYEMILEESKERVQQSEVNYC